jgi:branched-chain amino acid transport system substrate-binding protein
MGKSLKLAAVAGSVAILAAACSSGSSGGSASTGTSSGAPAASTPASSSAGGGGGGGKALVVGVDLPFQGNSADASNATYNAMQIYLDSVGDKAGNFSVSLKKYDDSTAAAGKWDQAQCTANAAAHVANSAEIAVMGTYNSGCAKIEIPTLEQAPDGPMLMVSHANTYVGLTKPWDKGDPDQYYPNGTRNYARVVTTDDYQGSAAAQFLAQSLKVKKCYVLNDNEAYGAGIAKSFVAAAKKQGITILANDAWDAKQANYTALFTKIKATNPDCVYIAGIEDNNGAQLVKDKVAVLGSNTAVKLMVPDGFSGYPDFQKLPAAQGVYLTFAGLSSDVLLKVAGPGKTLLDAYKTKYGAYPSTSYALYGVSALQVILKAIAGSDGTRKGATDQVFSGAGIDIPATESVLGKDIKIDPKTGDVNQIDITVELMKANTETFLMPWKVQ